MKTLRKVSYLVMTLLAAATALAEEAATATHAGAGSGLIGLGAALAITIAAAGGALGQGRSVAAAMDGISRNPSAQPKLFVALIIGLAFMETLVIFSLIIGLQLV